MREMLIMANQPAPKQRKAQIRPALAEAIVLMIESGRTIPEAAEIAGLKEESLRKALVKPHVKAHCADVMRAWRKGQTFQSWHCVAGLRQNAESEKVRLEASKVFIGAAGELEPERDRAPAVGLAIQIVIPESRSSIQPTVSENGVVEMPPFNPATFRGRVIERASVAYDEAD